MKEIKFTWSTPSYDIHDHSVVQGGATFTGNFEDPCSYGPGMCPSYVP